MSRTSTSSRSAPALPSRAFHSASASFSAAWCSRLVRIGRSSILATSNRSGIDSVVLAMRADEPDEHHAPVVVHRYDETIVVALDVENHAVVRDEARVPVRGLDTPAAGDDAPRGSATGSARAGPAIHGSSGAASSLLPWRWMGSRDPCLALPTAMLLLAPATAVHAVARLARLTSAHRRRL